MARQELKQLGARWSAADNGWWMPPLSVVERQVAEKLRYQWRREIEIIPLDPGSSPRNVPPVIPLPDMARHVSDGKDE